MICAQGQLPHGSSFPAAPQWSVGCSCLNRVAESDWRLLESGIDVSEEKTEERAANEGRLVSQDNHQNTVRHVMHCRNITHSSPYLCLYLPLSVCVYISPTESASASKFLCARVGVYLSNSIPRSPPSPPPASVLRLPTVRRGRGGMHPWPVSLALLCPTHCTCT